MDVNIEQESIRELSQRRHTLLAELRNYERSRGVLTSALPHEDQVGVIPVSFSCELS